MAIAFDAFSNSTNATTDRTWTHTPVGTPSGVIVYAVAYAGVVDEVVSVNYGGVGLSEVASSPLIFDSGEAFVVHCFFLGDESTIPTGAQTVTVSRGGSETLKIRAFCVTVTASGDTAVQDTTTITGTSADPSGVLSLGGVSCFCMLAAGDGLNSATITALSGWTEQYQIDEGIYLTYVATYDTVGTSDVTFGYTAAADERAVFGIAIKEAAATSVTAFPGSAAVAITGQAPTASVPASNITASPADAAVSASTAAPTAAATDNYDVAITDVALSIVTEQPSLAASAHVTGQPPATALDVGVLQPTASATDNHAVQPGAAGALITTIAPLVVETAGGSFQPGDAALSLTPLVPTATSTDNHIAAPDSGVLEVSTESPVVGGGVIVSTGSGSISVSGVEPTPLVALVAQCGSADVVVAGAIPSSTVSDHHAIGVPSSAVEVTGQQPWLAGTPQYAYPGDASVTLSGHAPSAWPGVQGRLLARPVARPATGAGSRVYARFTIASVRAK